ncbi:MAG: SPW repeat protein, partial [Gammaproteobacteria bacterium]|nr:SPW repeat protein [Gammaproteobacteria bacterium]
ISFAALYHHHLWEDVIHLMIGFWLVVSPFVLGFTAEKIAMMNHILVGVFIGIDAIVAILQTPRLRKA